MFDLSWSHILIFLVVALVVVGPKDMPRLLRMAGQWMGKARAMANEFRKSFDDMARQTELDELRQQIENLRHEQPLAGLHEDLNKSADVPLMGPLPTAISTATGAIVVSSVVSSNLRASGAASRPLASLMVAPPLLLWWLRRRVCPR